MRRTTCSNQAGRCCVNFNDGLSFAADAPTMMESHPSLRTATHLDDVSWSSLVPQTSVQPSWRADWEGGRWRWEERLVRLVGRRWMGDADGAIFVLMVFVARGLARVF